MTALLPTVLATVATLGVALAQDAPSFQRDVLPLLRERCVGCHRPDEHKGDVDLSSFAALMRGADDGSEIVVAGAPEHSLLLEVVVPQAAGTAPAMPEEGAPLTAAEVDLLRRWVAAGAIDDTSADAAPTPPARPPVYRTAPVITSLAWSPDGVRLAVSGRNEVLLHDMVGTAAPVRLLGRAVRVESLAWSPDGARLAVAGGAPGRFGEVQIWRIADATLLRAELVTGDCLFGVSWSPDGRLVAFGATDTAVRALDAESLRQVLYQGAHDDWVLDTAFSCDGSHLVTVGRDRSMKLTKVDSQQFIDNITSITPGALKGGLIAVARHPERDELLVGGADGVPALFKMFRDQKRVIGDDFNRIRSFAVLPGRVFDVAFLGADGARIVAVASSARGGEARAFRTEDGTELWRHEAAAGLYALAPSPDGTRVAVGGFEGCVEILDAATGTPLRRFVAVPLGPVDVEDVR
ncbi:MAG: hypothetical protein IPM29_04940 [Planctomycetes bacterium]|nr:hypothetical protein [Planctomycetota bacterium]